MAQYTNCEENNKIWLGSQQVDRQPNCYNCFYYAIVALHCQNADLQKWKNRKVQPCISPYYK